MAEHRPFFKNNQTTYYPRFSFTPKTGIAFPTMTVFNFIVNPEFLFVHFLVPFSIIPGGMRPKE